MHPDSIGKTEVIIPDRHYEYLKIQFGLTDYPAVFQEVVSKMCSGLQHNKLLAYMDDILIPSDTIEAGLTLLGEVLTLKAALKLNLAKCSFLQTKLEYRSHEICVGGIRKFRR